MTTNSLEQISNARNALALAKDMPDILEIRDFAVAASAYAKAAKLGLAAQNEAASVKLDAERKAGEALSQMERGHGPGRGKKIGHDGQSFNDKSEYAQALEDSDVPQRTAIRWQDAYNTIPEDEYQDFKQETIEIKL